MDIELAQALEENAKLKKENTELKDYRLTTLAKQQTGMSNYALNLEHKLSWYDDQLTKAKEIIKDMLRDIPNRMWYTDCVIKQAEQFLIEPDDRFEITEKGKEYLSSH